MNRTPLALSLALLAAPALAQGPPIFAEPAPKYPVGGKAVQPLAADLNGDGFLDALVVCGLTAPFTAGVHLGDGAGGFGGLSTFAIGGPSVLGDLNGDDVPDLVTPITDAFEVRLGDGHGGFGAPSTISVPGMNAVALGDVNGDDKLDAVMSGPGNHDALRVALGNGDGTFQPLVGSPGVLSTSDVQLADLNGDGMLDAATLDWGTGVSEMSAWLGNGTGGFATPLSVVLTTEDYVFPSLSNPADVNGDGHLDFTLQLLKFLLVESTGSLLIGDGVGHFAIGAAFYDFTSLPLLTTTLGDVNGDGTTDILVTKESVNSVLVRLGDGAGGFGNFVGYVVGSGPKQTALGDFDGNGRLDGITANSGTNDFSLLKNQLAYLTGIAPFGTGTHGCSGIHGISATSAPTVGNAAFKIASTGAPASTLGLLLIGDVADVAGTDLLSIGLTLHVDLVASSQVFALNAASDVNGYALAPAPIPANPAFAGVTVAAQTVFFWSACTPSYLHLSSSRGLSITFQP